MFWTYTVQKNEAAVEELRDDTTVYMTWNDDTHPPAILSRRFDGNRPTKIQLAADW